VITVALVVVMGYVLLVQEHVAVAVGKLVVVVQEVAVLFVVILVIKIVQVIVICKK
jgi:hypothetical protein